MEEKERYELIGYCSYRDTETGVIGDNFVELLNQQDKEIIKLIKENQQLKQRVNDWKQRFESSEERNKQMTDNGVKALELKNEKIKELKQQLSEKDNRIAELKEELDDKNFCKEFVDLYNENKILRAGLQEEQAQTAIEKLEKVKEYNRRLVYSSSLIDKFIDNQIKSLKGDSQ